MYTCLKSRFAQRANYSTRIPNRLLNNKEYELSNVLRNRSAIRGVTCGHRLILKQRTIDGICKLQYRHYSKENRESERKKDDENSNTNKDSGFKSQDRLGAGLFDDYLEGLPKVLRALKVSAREELETIGRLALRRRLLSLAILGIFSVFIYDYFKGYDTIEIYPEDLESELENDETDDLIIPDKVPDNLSPMEVYQPYNNIEPIDLRSRLNSPRHAAHAIISYLAAINLFFSDVFRKQTSYDLNNTREPFAWKTDASLTDFYSSQMLRKIISGGSLPVEPFSALLSPSPFNSHLTIVIDVDILFGISADESHGHVLKKRPFSDLLFQEFGDKVEIILVSTYHTKPVRHIIHILT